MLAHVKMVFDLRRLIEKPDRACTSCLLKLHWNGFRRGIHIHYFAPHLTQQTQKLVPVLIQLFRLFGIKRSNAALFQIISCVQLGHEASQLADFRNEVWIDRGIGTQ